MSFNPNLIELRHLAKSFGPQRVLRDVNLDIRKGETMVIIGSSGGGKSVILKHMIGLLRPQRGTVLVDGQAVGEMGESESFSIGVGKKTSHLALLPEVTFFTRYYDVFLYA